jgi:hypothetical protein
MADDIEGEIQEAPVEAPISEPSADPAEERRAEIRRAVDAQRERGPDGKFVKSESKGSEPTQRGPAKGVATGTPQPPRLDDGTADAIKAEATPGTRPPPGFSVATKQAWDALPDHVKADIAKRETEIDTGMKRYGGLANFAEEAERNGTTLQNAVSDYVAVETELRKDPVSGVEFLFKKMGLNPLGVLNQWLKRYVQPQGAPQPNPNLEPNRQPQIDPSAIVAQAVEQARHGVRSEFQQEQINNDIAKFSADPANRFFQNVRQDMSVLVQAGKASDLQTAYEAACWLHPEIRAILIEEMRGGQDKAATRTAARAQNAAKAVVGAPSSNSHAGEPPRRRDLSRREEIVEAIKAQRGAA